MSASSYAAGLLCLACIVGPWVVAALPLRAWIVPAASGAQARLAEIVLGLSGLVITTELTGAFGGFDRWPLAGVSVVVAAAVTQVAIRRAGPRTPRAPRSPARLRPDLVIAGLAVTASTAQWLSGAISSYRTGILQVESLHYHLSHSAFFVQTGTLWRPHEVSASSDAAFHPLTIELLHAIGMLAMRSDVLSLVINVLFLWVLFLAAWCAGQPVGAGPLAVTAAALLSVSLPMGGVAGGTALNDVAVVALLIAAVAVAGERSPDGWTGRAVVAGLALGLTFGSKLTAPAAVVCLALGWLWTRRRTNDHRRASVALVGCGVLAGSFWYIRDWWFFGSPFPGTKLEIFGVGLPKVPFRAIDGELFSVAHYLNSPHVVRHWYVPALHVDFGTLWPVVLALPLAGVVLACRRGRSVDDRILAFAATFAFLFYLVTPSGALGPPGQPLLFGTNVRYVLPAMALGLLVLAREPWLARRWWPAGVLILLELVTLSKRGDWPLHSPTSGTLAALVCVVVAVLLVLGWRRGPMPFAAGTAVVVVVAAVVGLPFTRHYERHRYAVAGSPFAPLFAWGSSVHHARIGFVGFPQSYPFYGTDFTNAVTYLGQSGPHHAFDDYRSCASWVDAVNAAHVKYVVVLIQPSDPAKYQQFERWTASAGGKEFFGTTAGGLFQIRGPLDPTGCAGNPALSG